MKNTGNIETSGAGKVSRTFVLSWKKKVRYDTMTKNRKEIGRGIA